MERQDEGAASSGRRGTGLTPARQSPVKAPLCRTFSPCESPGPPLDTRHRQWPVRLSVRTPGFQPGKRGSTPLRAATSADIEPTVSATCRTGGSVFPRSIHFVLRCIRNGNEPSHAPCRPSKSASGGRTGVTNLRRPIAGRPCHAARSPSRCDSLQAGPGMEIALILIISYSSLKIPAIEMSGMIFQQNLFFGIWF